MRQLEPRSEDGSVDREGAGPAGKEVLPPLLDLVVYLLASAELCTREPWTYGSLRLVEAASRLLGVVGDLGCEEGWVREYKSYLDAHKHLLLRDRREYISFLEHVAGPAASRVLVRGARNGEAEIDGTGSGELGERKRDRERPSSGRCDGGLPASDPPTESALLNLMRSRRVSREFAGTRLDRQTVEIVAKAGTWASSAGNRRLHRFVLIDSPATIRGVRSAAPGVFGDPAAMVVVCTDMESAARQLVQVEKDSTVWIDVGTAAMNMMLAAEDLSVGSCPVTSFSKDAVARVLRLPEALVPELILLLGAKPEAAKAPSRATAGKAERKTRETLVRWETVSEQKPEGMEILADEEEKGRLGAC